MLIIYPNPIYIYIYKFVMQFVFSLTSFLFYILFFICTYMSHIRGQRSIHCACSFWKKFFQSNFETNKIHSSRLIHGRKVKSSFPSIILYKTKRNSHPIIWSPLEQNHSSEIHSLLHSLTLQLSSLLLLFVTIYIWMH